MQRFLSMISMIIKIVIGAHQDSGYNGIVYFNKDDNTSGTNLYSDC